MNSVQFAKFLARKYKAHASGGFAREIVAALLIDFILDESLFNDKGQWPDYVPPELIKDEKK